MFIDLSDNNRRDWEQELTDRERKELDYDRLYVAHFGHGTDGHLPRSLIAKLAQIADRQSEELTLLRGQLANARPRIFELTLSAQTAPAPSVDFEGNKE